MPTIQEKIQALPSDLRKEVEVFVDSLAMKQRQLRRPGKPSLDWAGALRNLGGRYTSVSLQHELSDWRARET